MIDIVIEGCDFEPLQSNYCPMIHVNLRSETILILLKVIMMDIDMMSP